MFLTEIALFTVVGLAVFAAAGAVVNIFVKE